MNLHHGWFTDVNAISLDKQLKTKTKTKKESEEEMLREAIIHNGDYRVDHNNNHTQHIHFAVSFEQKWNCTNQ